MTISAIMVTHNRATSSREVIESCLSQSRPPERIVVVDVGTVPFDATGLEGRVAIEVLSPGRNIGPAGGIPLAARRLLQRFGPPPHYVVLLDDDDPFCDPRAIERAVRVLEANCDQSPPVVGVGHRGSVYDRRRMRTLRPSPAVHRPQRVDSLHGGFCAVYRLDAIAGLPVWVEHLFWGFEELAFGLHMQAQGGVLLSFEEDGVIGSRKASRIRGRPALLFHETPALSRYYALRNLLAIQRRFGASSVGLLNGIVRGVVKPMVLLPLQPRCSMYALVYGLCAIYDGTRDRFPYLGPPSSRARIRDVLGAYRASRGDEGRARG